MIGLKHCHDTGFVHLDLKPQNILFDKFYNLKIADFDLNEPFYELVNQGKLTKKVGTIHYMAPEVHLGRPYEGQKVDIFAAAIILFQMVTKRLPFHTAEPVDPIYRSVAAGRFDIFWKIQNNLKSGDETPFTEDFKSLVWWMLALDYEKRPTVSQVMSHPWMKGNVPTSLEVFSEFQRRQEQIKGAKK